MIVIEFIFVGLSLRHFAADPSRFFSLYKLVRHRVVGMYQPLPCQTQGFPPKVHGNMSIKICSHLDRFNFQTTLFGGLKIFINILFTGCLTNLLSLAVNLEVSFSFKKWKG